MSLAGVLTPQANTTVEQEMRRLLDVPFVTARLTCASPDSRERLIRYFEGVHETLAQFDTAPLEVVGFACTGSSYLVGFERERAGFAAARVPVLSAASAVHDALRQLGARRIALLSPYPEWLTQACVAFWRSREVEVVAIESPPGDRSDTRRIYALSARDASAGLEKLDAGRAQAILVSGTGMPSLEAIAAARGPLPVLSSNLCLAWRVRSFFSAQAIDEWLGPRAAWRSRP